MLVSYGPVPDVPVEECVTLAEARDHCRLDPTTPAPELAIYLDTAIRKAADYMRRELNATEYDAAYSCFPASGAPLVLPVAPASSVVSVTWTDAEGIETVMPAEEYELRSLLDGSAPYLTPTSGTWPDATAVAVRFRAGHGAGSVPAPIRSGVLIYCAELFERREQAIVGTISTPAAITAERCWLPYRMSFFE